MIDYRLVLDLLTILLLGATITYAVILNKRLGRLREDKAELEGLASTFGQATARAQESIGRLKATADDLQAAIDKADSLRDDLAFLLDRGSSAADRLEQLVRRARDEASGPTRPVSPTE